MNIDDLLRVAMERKASDLHLKVGNYPHLRIDGLLAPLSDQPRITAEEMLNMAFSIMSSRETEIQGKQRTRHGLRGGRPRPVPRERIPAARQCGGGTARDSHQDPGAG